MSTSSHAIEGFIFDLDGTLIDYEGASHQALAAPLVAHGHKELSWDLHSRVVGTKNEDWSRTIIKALGLEGKLDPEQYVKEYSAVMNTLYPEIKAWPGTVALLKELKTRGFRLAIATSSPRPSFDKKMVHHPEILTLMDAVVTGDEVENGKPAPDIFIAAAKLIGCNPTRTVIFEDSPFGIEGAQAAGALTVALPDPRFLSTTASRFEALKPDWSLAAIADFDLSTVELAPAAVAK